MPMPVSVVAILLRRACAAKRSSCMPRRFRSTPTGCTTAFGGGFGSSAEALFDEARISVAISAAIRDDGECRTPTAEPPTASAVPVPFAVVPIVVTLVPLPAARGPLVAAARVYVAPARPDVAVVPPAVMAAVSRRNP